VHDEQGDHLRLRILTSIPVSPFPVHQVRLDQLLGHVLLHRDALESMQAQFQDTS